MIQMQRCEHCGDLATYGKDGAYYCDKVGCLVQQIIRSITE